MRYYNKNFNENARVNVETGWAIVPVAPLFFYWLDACFHRFFVFMQPIKTSGGMVRNVPKGASPLLFVYFPKCLHYSVSIAHKVSNTLPAFPKESPVPIRCWPEGLQQSAVTFPVHLRRNRHFFLFLEVPFS
jgi:hypothetical protein